jgi:UrcA family protein
MRQAAFRVPAGRSRQAPRTNSAPRHSQRARRSARRGARIALLPAQTRARARCRDAARAIGIWRRCSRQERTCRAAALRAPDRGDPRADSTAVGTFVDRAAPADERGASPAVAGFAISCDATRARCAFDAPPGQCGRDPDRPPSALDDSLQREHPWAWSLLSPARAAAFGGLRLRGAVRANKNVNAGLMTKMGGVTVLSVQIRVAVGLFLFLSASALLAAQDVGSVTVRAVRKISVTTVGRTASGIPLVDVSLSYGVSLQGIDLASQAGATELKRRITATARLVCKELGRQHPDSRPNDRNCAKEAADDAMITANQLIAAAKKPGK